MKRHKYLPGSPGVTLFTAICDYDNIKLAHENASRGKGFYKEVQMVNKDPDKYLKHIQYLLLSHQFKTSKYEIFERIEHDKVRKIYKLPYYPDRIIQWAILQIIGPIMECNFIYDTYSSIKGRGPLLCMQRIHKAAYYHYKNNSDDMQFYLKLDVRKFYPSINHDILKQKYANLFKDDELLDLIYEIIDSVTPEEGVPIGNFLSQFSGNIYLSDFDHMMKEEFKIKYYFRYMDDIVIFGDNLGDLGLLAIKIKNILKYNYDLDIKYNYYIRSLSEGLDFVGYIIYPTYVLLRKRIKQSLIDRCIMYNGKIMTPHRRSSIGSLRGFAYYANAYNLQQKYVVPLYKQWGINTDSVGTEYK